MPALIAAAATACGDTARPLGLAGIDALSVLFVVESPDSIQPMLLMRATPGPPLTAAVEVRDDADRLVATATLPAEFDTDELRPCQQRYGPVIGFARCAVLAWTPEPGGSYHVVVTAPDLPTARAEVAVPAAYHLLSLHAEYDRSAVRHIDIEWSASAGAYRYYAMIQPSEPPTCFRQNECRNQGWLRVTEGTHIAEDIPDGTFADARGPWTLSVLAVSEPLHRAMNSGSGEGLFPVPPASNVEGGYGVMGAWVRASELLP
ncbi:MAG TPA: DUF4249 family protein [Longimicrobiales bacterium]